MPTLARQIRRTQDAFGEVKRRDRMLTKALIADKVALEKAQREAERLMQMVEASMDEAAVNHFAKAIDSLDAAVFSGDGLLDADNRELFKRSMERWQRKLVEWEEIAADLDNENEHA